MATKSADLYVRIEPDVKEQAENILSALGIPASNAINMFYKQIILHGGLPFEVKRAVPNSETRAALAEYEQMKRNPEAYKRHDSFDEALNESRTDA